MEEIKTSNTSFSLINDDLISCAENDFLLIHQIKSITLNKFLQKKYIIYFGIFFILFQLCILKPLVKRKN